MNNLLLYVDRGEAVLVALLDLSAAFDTIDHTILLDLMSSCFGISGSALQWFQSYLFGRTQCVSVNGSFSPPVSRLFVSSKVLYVAPSFLSCTTVLFTTSSPFTGFQITAMQILSSSTFLSAVDFHQCHRLHYRIQVVGCRE